MEELITYLIDLNQEVLARANAEEDGALLEETATRYLLDLLEAAGEVENSQVCHDAREDKAGRIMHRLSAYALEEDGASINLFITTYYPPGSDEEGPRTFGKADLEKSVSQATRFLETAMKGYLDQIDESAPVFPLALHLSRHQRELIRARIFILTNGRATSPEGAANERKVRDVLVNYELWDIERFQRLNASSTNREPIVIDFGPDNEHQPIRCLPMPVATTDYQTWLAIVPGTVLAGLYQRHGQRLLERNVRAFLQFSTKVNRGIQETILKQPERFLAYNNGLAATAARVELTEDGTAIRRIHDLQIVNGGQTTAAICQTQHQKKEEANLDKVFVQMKLTVLGETQDADLFTSLIAQFANTQNQIKQTDLSANAPFNVALQKISRSTWAPALTGTGQQTRWFFERARGQFKVERAATLTKANQKKFDEQNPRRQLLTKELVAKYRLAWERRPHTVALGGEKVYASFRAGIRDGQEPNRTWFEDVVALAILWREADTAYTTAKGVGTKFLAVPYTLAWLSHVTGSVGPADSIITCLDLPGIWKRQGLTGAQRALIQAAVPVVDAFILSASAGRLPSEWAKRAEAWDAVRRQGVFGLDKELAAVRAELLPTGQVEARYKADESSDVEQAEQQQLRAELADIPPAGWERIISWGQGQGIDGHSWLTPHQVSICERCTVATRQRRLSDIEVRGAHTILSRVLEHAADLLVDVEDNPLSNSIDKPSRRDITLTDVEELLTWEKKNKKLTGQDAAFLIRLKRGEQRLNDPAKAKVRYLIQRAALHGFAIAVPV